VGNVAAVWDTWDTQDTSVEADLSNSARNMKKAMEAMDKQMSSPLPEIEACLAAGALAAIENVLRHRLTAALREDVGRRTVHLPLLEALVLAEFAEACWIKLEGHSPAVGEFLVEVREMLNTVDVADEFIGFLSTPTQDVFADSVKPKLSWFVGELARVMTCVNTRR
jgi:hypothetical protein